MERLIQRNVVQMALVEFGGGVAGMRGSTGGTTYTRTKAGAIQRNRVIPTNPQTTYQTDARSIITELSQAWGQTLTQAQRDGWTTFGTNFPTTNKLGQATILSGIQAFTRLGSRLVAAGESYLATAPADQDVSELQTFTSSLDLGAGGFEATWTAVGTLTNDKLVIEATPGISPGISNWTNRLRRVFTSSANPTSATAYGTELAARLGLPSVGQKVGLRAHFIRTTNGAVSSPLIYSGLVVST